MMFATSFSKSNWNKMNQEGNSASQSSSKSSKLKSSGSSKSSTETPAEKLKRKSEKKDKSTDSIETTPYRSKTEKNLEQVIPTATPVRSTYKEKSLTETPAEKLMRKSDKQESKTESKSKDSSETREEKAQRRKEKREKREKREKEKEKKKMKKEQIKTLQARVKDVESENRHLREENTAMQDLEKHLNQAEEQLEYATEENREFSTRVHALEQALVGQETELDNALATIRKQKKRERKLLDAEKAADSVVGDAELAHHVQVEQQLAYREELDAIQEEVDLLRHERDEAIGRAITLSMETATLKAEVSESCDHVTECKVVIEQLRTLWQNSLAQQSSSASVCSVSKKMDRRPSTSSVSSFSGLPISIRMNTLGSLWGFGNKDDDKSIVSNYDEDCMLDQTEDNTDASEEDWDLEETKVSEQSVVFC
jgi:hypothetical protein